MMSRQDVYEQVGVAMTCRSLQEYVDMFQLSGDWMSQGPILDVAAGASSFVAQIRRAGADAVAVDPLYQGQAEELYARGKQEIADSTEKLRNIAHTYDWGYYGSLEQHRLNREQALEEFIQTYANDDTKQIFVPGGLPRLPFADDRFSLVFCSHFLFLYHQQFDEEFHRQAIAELVRVCRPSGEVRLYPLVGLDRKQYAHLAELISDLRQDGHEVALVPTTFRFLEGATRFLQIGKKAAR